MLTWYTTRVSDGRRLTVEGYESLDVVLAEMAASSWEEPTNKWISYVTDENGEAVALALFGPGMELLVACADGRMLKFPVPACYR